MISIMAATVAVPVLAKKGGAKLIQRLAKGRKGTAAQVAASNSITDGVADVSKFLDATGIRAPLALRKRAAEWNTFKEGAEFKKRGALGALYQQSPARRVELAKSGLAQYAKDTMAILPTFYVADTAMGLTTPPGAETPKFYDLPGHAENFVKWLPRYAAFDIGGRAAFMLPTLSKYGIGKMGARAKESRGVARAVSRSWTMLEKSREGLQKISAPLRNAYNQNVRHRMNPVASGLAVENRALMRRLAGKARTGVTNMARRAMGGSSLYDMRGHLRSAEGVFDEGGLSARALKSVSEDAESPGNFNKLYNALFVEGDQSALSRVAKLFGGRATAWTDVRSMADQKTKEQVAQLEKRIATFQQKVNADEGASEAAKEFAARLDINKLRVGGFTKIKGEVMRMPTGGEIKGMIGAAMDRTTRILDPTSGSEQRGLVLSRLFGLQAFHQQRPMVEVVKDGLSISGKMNYFTNMAEKGAPKSVPFGTPTYDYGFAIADKPGGRWTEVFGIGQFGDDPATRLRSLTGGQKQYAMTSLGGTKMQRIMARHAARRGTGSSMDEEEPFRLGPLARLTDWLELGHGRNPHSKGFFGRLMNGANMPRKLFATNSPFWKAIESGDYSSKNVLEGMRYATHALSRALGDSADLYTQRSVFKEGVRELGNILDPKLKNFQPGKAREDHLDSIVHKLLNDEEYAVEVTERAMRELAPTTGGDVPAYAAARKALNEIAAHPDNLRNITGERKAQTLRRYLFEQGILKQSTDGVENVVKAIDDLSLLGYKTEKTLEAKAGLAYLRAHIEHGGTPSHRAFLNKPFTTHTGSEADTSVVMQSLGKVYGSMQKELQAFGASRPRSDLRYSKMGHRAQDGPEYGMANFFTVSSKWDAARYLAEGAFDTTREALSFIGAGWKPRAMDQQGIKEVGSVWLKRGLALAAGTFAYRTADFGTDMLPDGTPLSEGITVSGAKIAANARLAASWTQDAFGISDAAAYMEGLMPKSTSTLPGAAIGYYAAGWRGAAVGAVANRLTSELLKDTPFEALSILPPFAPFVSDMAESYDETRAKYEGNALVPVRKGRYFLLSSSDYSGGRIQQWRPNWYNLTRSQYTATPSLYGSKLERYIHQDLPLVDFSLGDFFDPQYLQKKNFNARPYVEPDRVFSDVPIIGPMLGATVGSFYNMVHPMASNRPMHLNDIVGQFEGEGGPASGGGLYGQALISTGLGQRRMVGGPVTTRGLDGGMVGEGTIIGSNSFRASFDEQVYRMTEALGFSGFALQQAIGGEGVFRDAVFPAAGDMDSGARTIHDMNMGDMLGVGEGLRRLYPFERNRTKFGPRNTMASWMPSEMQQGDPYCLLPDTLMEVDGDYIPAREAYSQVMAAPDTHQARTHKGAQRAIQTAAVRDVDEEVVRIEVLGLPWPLEVTTAHPIGVRRDGQDQWVLAGDLCEGDEVIVPSAPMYDVLNLNDGPETSQRHLRPHSGPLMEAMVALYKLPPPPGFRFWADRLSEEEIFSIDQAFHLAGAKHPRRDHALMAKFRRQLAEEGVPPSLVGAGSGALRVLVKAWSTPIDGGLEIRLDEDRLGLKPQADWHRAKRYEPVHTPRQALVRGAWTLKRAFDAARTPAELTEHADGSFVITLMGRSASTYLFTHRQRMPKQRRDAAYSGRRRLSTRFTLKPKTWRGRHAYHPVAKITRFHYTGPVYAFQVRGHESFVAAGVATHNSKIAMGEALLPGAGYEAQRMMGGQPELNLDTLGGSIYESTMNMLGLSVDETPTSHTWAKEQAVSSMLATGMAVRRDALYVDEKSRLVSIAAAITKGNQPVHVEAMNDAEFRSTYAPRELDLEKANAMLGSAKRAKASVVYVNADTGETQTFVHRFDSGLYNSTLQKLQTAQKAAREAASMGYGKEGAMYSTLDRMQVLLNAAPFSQEWKREERKAKAFAATGMLSAEEQYRYRELLAMHRKMSMPFEIYQSRFSYDQLLDPDQTYHNLTYNDNIQAAANYSAPERMLGSIWETWSNLRTPLHSKFFGAYNLEEAYTRNVLLDRDFQSWGSPIDDFVKPYMRGLVAADDPLQGGLSYGIGGLVFGGPLYGFAGAGLGTLYGAVHGGYRKLTGTSYIPQPEEEVRDAEQMFDRIKYYRASRLYKATGSAQYMKEMEQSAYGWTQSGLLGTGWAKDRRRSYTPSNRMDSRLFGNDRGFNSPWAGQEPVQHFRDAMRSHTGDALALADGMKGHVSRVPQRIPYGTSEQAYASLSEADRVAVAVTESGFGGPSERSTPVRGNEGFGSPWRGQNPAYDVTFNALNPDDPFPAEMYTAFAAAPRPERDFMQAALLLQDRERQERFLRLASPDMAAMLDVGWSYLYGQDSMGRTADPMKRLNYGLADHPVMGMGADQTGYQIRTMEDLGLDAHDAGLGWKQHQLRMNASLVTPTTVAGAMAQQQGKTRSPEEVRSIIQTALAQMGVVADVDVRSTRQATEMHLSQR